MISAASHIQTGSLHSMAYTGLPAWHSSARMTEAALQRSAPIFDWVAVRVDRQAERHRQAHNRLSMAGRKRDH